MWRRSNGLLTLAALALACSRLQADDAIPFSHKRHAPMKLDCSYCHTTAYTGERAGYPAASICMTCHIQIAKDRPAILRLAQIPANDKIEPERSVYMLAEFVHFSHARHRAARVACQTCHGDVSNMDIVEQAMPMTMKACITCHRTHRATTTCGKCHSLAGQ